VSWNPVVPMAWSRGVVLVVDTEMLADDVATDEAAGAGSQLGHGK
jgi:hypothetical protein